MSNNSPAWFPSYFSNIQNQRRENRQKKNNKFFSSLTLTTKTVVWTPLSSYSQLSCTMTILRVAQQHCKSVTLSINFHFSSHNPNLHHQFSLLLAFFLSSTFSMYSIPPHIRIMPQQILGRCQISIFLSLTAKKRCP